MGVIFGQPTAGLRDVWGTRTGGGGQGPGWSPTRDINDDITERQRDAEDLGTHAAQWVRRPHFCPRSDSKQEYSDVCVTLQGGEGHFELTKQDNIIYLVIMALPLDRDSRPNYTLCEIVTDVSSPPLH